MKSGKGFDLEDFKAQIGADAQDGRPRRRCSTSCRRSSRAPRRARTVDERKIARIEGIINSMTPAERAKPEILKASRKRRIAAGAGVSVQEVNQLLNQFEQTQKMMKMVAKGGMQKMMRGMKGLLPRACAESRRQPAASTQARGSTPATAQRRATRHARPLAGAADFVV